MLVPADWLESAVRLAPLPALLYLAADPPDLEAHFLFLSLALLPPSKRGGITEGLGLAQRLVPLL